MPKQTLIKELAKLAVKVGVNVQKGQTVVVRSTTDTAEMARAVAHEAYEAGAKDVRMIWQDPYISHDALIYQSKEDLTDIPESFIKMYQEVIDAGACLIAIVSPVPGLNSDTDPEKSQALMMATNEKLGFYRQYTMGNQGQWTIIGAPNIHWAEKVFPKLKGEEAVEALYQAILEASRVREGESAIENWDKHNETLLAHNQVLNDYNFKSLHFKNSKGTDIVVGLVKNHRWAGGGEHTTKGVYFNPNIPTEENFTMPDRLHVDGKVYSTKPLDYQGRLIDEFWLVFKDGKVVDFDAKHEKETLAKLLDTDEGSRSIGEIALISHNSPISNTNLLFYNTLYDENASCHMALGRAYPMNVKGGLDMSEAQLKEAGANHSLVHVDFMFGSEDMEITGLTQDGKEVAVFKKGNFVI